MEDPPKDPVGDAITRTAAEVLATKAKQPMARVMVLAVLAGVFIAFGSMVALVAQSSIGGGADGAVQLLSGFAFSVGLVMVMIMGAELFTGNTMMVLPVATGVLAAGRMALAWGVAWLGNLVGSVVVALLFAASGGLEGAVGEAAAGLVEGRLSKSAQAVFCSAILANMLVCAAVWMSMSAPTLPAKILAITGPVMIFVAAGLEHSVANMSILPMGWLSAPLTEAAWLPGLQNLVLSTLGNVVGGCLLVTGLAFGHDALRRTA